MESIYEKVGRTAFVIAEWRAEESESASPLFSDHLANIFLNVDTSKNALAIAEDSPSTRFLVRYRTRYFDDLILQKIRQGIKQFVILGSGLDTRPIRLGAKGVTFYELDQKHVLDYKAQQIKEFGYEQNSIFIPCDYTDVDFIEKLKDKGFDPSLETFLLWEGNIFYLKYNNIFYVLNSLKHGIDTFELTFDYLSQKLINRATGFKRSEDLLNGFSQIGAPWNTGFDDISDLAKQVGLLVKENFLIADYSNEIGKDIHIDPKLFDDYSICIFTNKTK
ncbi:class I SAM-dependent methyltransferase [Bacillus sp. FJAT-26377]|nr:SAM-dependent methyltransferase [Bacillus sp. FJAT-26377]